MFRHFADSPGLKCIRPPRNLQPGQMKPGLPNSQPDGADTPVGNCGPRAKEHMMNLDPEFLLMA